MKESPGPTFERLYYIPKDTKLIHMKHIANKSQRLWLYFKSTENPILNGKARATTIIFGRAETCSSSWRIVKDLQSSSKHSSLIQAFPIVLPIFIHSFEANL